MPWAQLVPGRPSLIGAYDVEASLGQVGACEAQHLLGSDASQSEQRTRWAWCWSVDTRLRRPTATGRFARIASCRRPERSGPRWAMQGARPRPKLIRAITTIARGRASTPIDRPAHSSRLLPLPLDADHLCPGLVPGPTSAPCSKSLAMRPSPPGGLILPSEGVPPNMPYWATQKASRPACPAGLTHRGLGVSPTHQGHPAGLRCASCPRSPRASLDVPRSRILSPFPTRHRKTAGESGHQRSVRKCLGPGRSGIFAGRDRFPEYSLRPSPPLQTNHRR